MAKGECFAIDTHGPVLQRADDVVGGVFQRMQVAAVVPAQSVGGGDEHLADDVRMRPRADS